MSDDQPVRYTAMTQATIEVVIQDPLDLRSDRLLDIAALCLQAAKGDVQGRREILGAVYPLFVEEQEQRAVDAISQGDYDKAVRHASAATGYEGTYHHGLPRGISPQRYRELLEEAIANTHPMYFLERAQAAARQDNCRTSNTRRYVELGFEAMKRQPDLEGTYRIIKRKLIGTLIRAYNLELQAKVKEVVGIATGEGRQAKLELRLFRGMVGIRELMRDGYAAVTGDILGDDDIKELERRLDGAYRTLHVTIRTPGRQLPVEARTALEQTRV